MIRILIVAAYASVRAELHDLLADAPNFTIIGEVMGSAELERLLPETRPDVVLFDHNESDAARLPGVLTGGDAGLVVLGDTQEDFLPTAAASLPGWACLLREAEGPEIEAAIRAVAVGLVVLDRSLTALLAPAQATRAVDTVSDSLPGETPTAREREVLELMARGLANKNIAARLNISLHTVKFHVASILAKLGASSRTEAVTIGARRGYIMI